MGKLSKKPFGYIEYFDVDEIERANGLPVDLIKAFEDTASAQRSNQGCPENIMRNIQRYSGGGVLSHIIEHVGDLTHRLTHHIKFGSVYQGYVEDKVDIGLRSLKSSYGFEKEYGENLINNAEYKGISVDEFKSKIDEMLLNYAEGHKKIPVYNIIQWHAREAAIQLGLQNFSKAKVSLEFLENELKNENTFVLRATMVHRNEDKEIIQFTQSDLNLKLELRPELAMK